MTTVPNSCGSVASAVNAARTSGKLASRPNVSTSIAGRNAVFGLQKDRRRESAPRASSCRRLPDRGSRSRGGSEAVERVMVPMLIMPAPDRQRRIYLRWHRCSIALIVLPTIGSISNGLRGGRRLADAPCGALDGGKLRVGWCLCAAQNARQWSANFVHEGCRWRSLNDRTSVMPRLRRLEALGGASSVTHLGVEYNVFEVAALYRHHQARRASPSCPHFSRWRTPLAPGLGPGLSSCPFGAFPRR